VFAIVAAGERIPAGRDSNPSDGRIRAAADAEMLALALERRRVSLTEVEIVPGIALFIALMIALPVWRRRLIKDFNRKISLGAGSGAAHARDRIEPQ